MPKKRNEEERCRICRCLLHRGGEYATPTVQGRSHATEHHFVAERFFGRSATRAGSTRERIYRECPWGLEGQSAVYCYDCHELLLHNPVLSPSDVDAFAALVRARGFDEEVKSDDLTKLAGRIKLLQEVISAGLVALGDRR